MIDGLPDDVVGLDAEGVIEARDYDEVIVPLIERKLRDHDRIKLLYRVGRGFERYTAGAIWSDTRIGIKHFTRFSRVALVSDVELDPPLRPAVRPDDPGRGPRLRRQRDRGGKGLDQRLTAQPRSRISRAFWRCQSRLASVARLSWSFLPLAMPSWSFALPRSLK